MQSNFKHFNECKNYLAADSEKQFFLIFIKQFRVH